MFAARVLCTILFATTITGQRSRASSGQSTPAPELLENQVKQLLEDNRDIKKRISQNEDNVFGIFQRLQLLETSFNKINDIMVANQIILDTLNVSANITKRIQALENTINRVSLNLSTSVKKLSMSTGTRLKELNLTVTSELGAVNKRLSLNVDNATTIFTRLDDLESFTKTMFKNTIQKVSRASSNLSTSMEKLSMSTETRIKELNLTVTSELEILNKRPSLNNDNATTIFTRLDDLEGFTKRMFEKTINEVSVSTRNLSTSMEKLSMSAETRLEELTITVTSELRDKKSAAIQLFETLGKALAENWYCKPEWKLFCTSEKCKCYFFVEAVVDWHQALNNCRRLGGDLASIHSDEESEFIGKTVNPSALGVWIGLNDKTKEGRFEWTDGSPMDYTNWHPLMDVVPNGGREDADLVFIVDGKWLQSPILKGTGRVYKSVCQEQINIEQIRSSESFMTDLSVKWTNRPIQNLGKALENSVCDQGWKLRCDSISCNCYFYEIKGRSWSDALSNCKSFGSDLLSIHSYDEMRFVKEMVGVNGRFGVWIGLTKTGCEGKFAWSDGTPMDFLNWYASEPDDKCNEHCGGLNIARSWSDRRCERLHESVCKMNIPKTP